MSTKLKKISEIVDNLNFIDDDKFFNLILELINNKIKKNQNYFQFETSWKTYGEYKTDNYGLNALFFKVNGISFYFSYNTIIAFHSIETGLVISKNDWGPTTGKHLNWIDRDKKKRIDRSDFVQLLNSVLSKIGFNF